MRFILLGFLTVTNQKGCAKMFRSHQEAKAVVAMEGITRRTLSYNDDIMLCEFILEEGATLPPHSHPHVQATYLVSGKISYTNDEGTRVLTAGDTALSDSNVAHSVIAHERSVALDVFTPMRKDYVD